MLLDFLIDNRSELISRARAKVASRQSPKATVAEMESGVPLFLDQLAETLKREDTAAPFSRLAIGESATRHGSQLLRMGFSVGQVVHDYGDICQAVTELAMDRDLQITNAEFHTLNLSLDNAIAGAVAEWGRQREVNLAKEESERLGVLAHEQRNLVGTALLALQMLRNGSVGIQGSTGAVLVRSLERLRNLNNGSLADVRLASGLQTRARIELAGFIEEEEVAAAMDAAARGIQLTVEHIARGLAVKADRMILGSALANVLQNAFKFTKQGGSVFLRVREDGQRVLIEVEDQCGGLQPGSADFFAAFSRPASKDASGLGLGLSIARRGVEASGGTLQVRNLPGRGCVFTIELPVDGRRAGRDAGRSDLADILVVDDDHDVTEMLCEILREYGHRVRSANSGEEGLRILKARPLPDVVVLDVDMPPGMSGPAMAHEMLMRDAGAEKIPVILLSGNDELKQIADRMGTPYFLSKPASLQAFMSVLERAQRERLPPASA